MSYQGITSAILSALFLTIGVSSSGFAQTSKSISAGAGATLNYDLKTTSGTTYCGPGFSQRVNYTVYQYTNFSYTANGVTTPINIDEANETFFPGSQSTCSPQPPPSSFFPVETLLSNGVPVFFSSVARGLTSAWTGYLVQPGYKLVSILYATPGNYSSACFTNTQTNGTTSSFGENVTQSTTLTYVEGIPPFFSAGVQFGTASSSGFTDAFTETIADGSGVCDASNSAGPNTISHNQDLFVLWLNPVVVMSQNSSNSTTIDYSLATPYSNGSYGQGDIVEVTAQALQPNAQNVTSVPIKILQRQYDPATGKYDLPGLADICADQSQYKNNCSSGGQCGCVPSDFSNILANDPILNTASSANPMAVDKSGATTCLNPTSSDLCRYVIVPEQSGSSIQKTAILQGPDCFGCNRDPNTFIQTDATQSTHSFNQGNSEVSGITAQAGIKFVGLQITNTITTTDSESTGTINGMSNQSTVTLSSSTEGCYQDILIFEDTAFHTFVTQQAPGDNSCP